MARGINKVILIGNLGADPEVKYMPSGGAVANIRVATSEAWKDRQSGQMQEKTEWHRVVMFNRLGEIAGEYLRKGSKVYIEGSLRTNKWQDQQGQDRYTTEIIANSMQMLDAKGSSGGFDGGQSSSSNSNFVPNQGTQAQDTNQNKNSGLSNNAPHATADTNNMATANAEFADDDIPF